MPGTKVGQVLSYWPYNKEKRLGHCIEDLAQEGFWISMRQVDFTLKNIR